MTQDQHQIYRMIFMMSPGVILFLGKFVFGKRKFYRGIPNMTVSNDSIETDMGPIVRHEVYR